jgi:hypothetical protein
MIIEIALGIVLAVVILSYLDYILALGWLLFLAVFFICAAGIVIYLGYEHFSYITMFGLLFLSVILFIVMFSGIGYLMHKSKLLVKIFRLKEKDRPVGYTNFEIKRHLIEEYAIDGFRFALYTSPAWITYLVYTANP